MGKKVKGLEDKNIQEWIKSDERFEGRADGGGLYLRYRKIDAVPQWRFRYYFAGQPRIMNFGTYSTITLAQARVAVKKLAAKSALGTIQGKRG